MIALSRGGSERALLPFARQNGTSADRTDGTRGMVRETNRERAAGVLVLALRRRPAAVPGVFLLNARRDVARWRLPGRRRARG